MCRKDGEISRVLTRSGDAQEAEIAEFLPEFLETIESFDAFSPSPFHSRAAAGRRSVGRCHWRVAPVPSVQKQTPFAVTKRCAREGIESKWKSR